MIAIKVGIIGGSGMNDPDILHNQKERFVTTPFGDPSDVLFEGEVGGIPCVILARHGRKHTILPHEVNYRANIWALKQVGCTHILASTACGGLQEHTQPGDLVVLDQYLDRTQGRAQTFYGSKPGMLEGVLHLPMAEPFCEETRQVLIEAARKVVPDVYEEESCPHPCLHIKGSAVSINGPRFSTRLESQLFHRDGIDVINMTLVPEVVLAREAGLSYASIAMVTDYDSWKPDTSEVCVDKVLSVFRQNVSKVKQILIEAIKLIGAKDWDATIGKNHALLESSRQDLAHNKAWHES